MIVSDGVSQEGIQQYQEVFKDTNQLIMVLGVGNDAIQSSSAADWGSLKKLASDTDGRYYALTTDDSDINKIASDVERHMQISGESAMPWRDMATTSSFP